MITKSAFIEINAFRWKLGKMLYVATFQNSMRFLNFCEQRGENTPHPWTMLGILYKLTLQPEGAILLANINKICAAECQFTQTENKKKKKN